MLVIHTHTLDIQVELSAHDLSESKVGWGQRSAEVLLKPVLRGGMGTQHVWNAAVESAMMCACMRV